MKQFTYYSNHVKDKGKSKEDDILTQDEHTVEKEDNFINKEALAEELVITEAEEGAVTVEAATEPNSPSVAPQEVTLEELYEEAVASEVTEDALTVESATEPDSPADVPQEVTLEELSEEAVATEVTEEAVSEEVPMQVDAQSAEAADGYSDPSQPKCHGGVNCPPSTCTTHAESFIQTAPFNADPCDQYITYNIGQIKPSGLGRILEVSLKIESCCPGRKIALAVILYELDSRNVKYLRGTKTYVVTNTTSSCCNLTIDNIYFVLPECLDMIGNQGSICDSRKFILFALAHYI